MDAITVANEFSDLPLPLGVKAHSTRSMGASNAFLAGVPMQDICDAAEWSTALTFVLALLFSCHVLCSVPSHTTQGFVSLAA